MLRNVLDVAAVRNEAPAARHKEPDLPGLRAGMAAAGVRHILRGELHGLDPDPVRAH